MSILLFLFGFLLGWRLREIFDTSWHEVLTDYPKPFGWWYHKVMCELSYILFGASTGYDFHLKVMCDKYGFDLYGVQIL